MQKRVLTVYQTNNYIKGLLEEDVLLSDIFVQGEISNFKNHSSGHMYFTLKDEYASINCVMFKTEAYNLRFKLQNGMKVILYGRVSLYEKTGNYQIYVSLIEPEGKGALHISFEQLKKKLEKEGLFSPLNKKALPTNPNCIALITSQTGAVVQDMIRISKRINPTVSIIIVPVLVQGKDASNSIASAIQMVNEWGKADVIIVGRGGGSAEELWAFNEEEVARAIYYSDIPVISAVGHETDFTISDFVADVRASTPSAAIEICLPNKIDMLDTLYNYLKTLDIIMENKIEYNKNTFLQIISRRIFTDPIGNIYNKQIYLSTLKKSLSKEMDSFLVKEKSKVNLLATNLNNLSPLNILEKGYSIIYKNGKVVKSIKDIEKLDIIKVKLKDGDVLLNIQKDEKEEV